MVGQHDVIFIDTIKSFIKSFKNAINLIIIMFIINMRGQAAVHGRRSCRRQNLLLLLPQMVAMQLFLVLLLQLVFTRGQ